MWTFLWGWLHEIAIKCEIESKVEYLKKHLWKCKSHDSYKKDKSLEIYSLKNSSNTHYLWDDAADVHIEAMQHLKCKAFNPLAYHVKH